MSDKYGWGKTRSGESWHLSDDHTNEDLMIRWALCGKKLVGALLRDRPGNEKSCESCLRIAGPQ